MKFIIDLITYFFLGYFISGCALFKQNVQEVRAPVVSTKKGLSKPDSQKVKSAAVYEFIGEGNFVFEFKNLDTDLSHSLVAKAGVLVNEIPQGHWELVGYTDGKNTFASMNTSKKFVFRIKPKTQTYIGSFLLGCPSINNHDFKRLKQMKFFNRYPFSSDVGLCELVVGSDFVGVSRSLKKSKKINKLNLVLGF